MIQLETIDCGAVALGIVLAYYGFHASMDELRAQCHISRNGIRLSNIAKAAQHFGLKVIYTETVVRENAHLIFPLILFWKKRHFVVLEGFSADVVYINDPQKGRYTVRYDHFNQYFSGQALSFALTSRFKKKKKESAIYRTISQLYHAKPGCVLFLFLSSLLSTGLNVVSPMLSKIYIDHYHISGTQWFLSFFIMIFIFGLSHASNNYAQQKILRVIEQNYTQHLSHEVIGKLLKLSSIFFTYRRAGELCYLPKSAQLLSTTLTGPIFVALISVLQACVYGGIMIYLNLGLGFMAAFLSGCNLVCLVCSQDKIKSSSFSVQQKMGQLSSLLAGYVVNILSIKATGNEEFFAHQCEESMREHLEEYYQFSMMSAITQSVSLFLTMLAYILIIGAAIWLLSNGKLTVGELIAFNMLFFAMNQSLWQVLKLKTRFYLVDFHDQKIREITESRYLPMTCEVKEVDRDHQSAGKIEIIDLTFGYDRTAPPLFDKLNLEIKPYSKTAIIGSSGSGKTTLIHLISGIYQPWSGTILIDGIPISSLSMETRSKLIGVVGQEQFFFKGSIKDNVCLWSKNNSDEAILDAMDDACIKEHIQNFEDGLNFELTDGATNLSGGQRQRLEIARTLLTRPKILILDEATSAVDPFVEKQLYEHLFKKKMTFICVAHRYNTIKNYDHIFILKKGQLVAEGTPEILMSKRSVDYVDLFCLSE